jgi:hypothetical protein
MKYLSTLLCELCDLERSGRETLFYDRLTFFTSQVQVESDGFFDVFHFSAAEGPDVLNDPRSVYGSDLVGFDF